MPVVGCFICILYERNYSLTAWVEHSRSLWRRSHPKPARRGNGRWLALNSAPARTPIQWSRWLHTSLLDLFQRTWPRSVSVYDQCYSVLLARPVFWKLDPLFVWSMTLSSGQTKHFTPTRFLLWHAFAEFSNSVNSSTQQAVIFSRRFVSIYIFPNVMLISVSGDK